MCDRYDVRKEDDVDNDDDYKMVSWAACDRFVGRASIMIMRTMVMMMIMLTMMMITKWLGEVCDSRFVGSGFHEPEEVGAVPPLTRSSCQLIIMNIMNFLSMKG